MPFICRALSTESWVACRLAAWVVDRPPSWTAVRARTWVVVRAPMSAALRPVIAVADNARRFEAVAALIAEWRPTLLVVGIASHADGSPHETGRLALRFGQRLHGRFGLPVQHVDERLTSHAAEAALREAGLDRARRAAVLDSAAAAEILRTWFSASPP